MAPKEKMSQDEGVGDIFCKDSVSIARRERCESGLRTGAGLCACYRLPDFDQSVFERLMRRIVDGPVAGLAVHLEARDGVGLVAVVFDDSLPGQVTSAAAFVDGAAFAVLAVFGHGWDPFE